MSILPPEYSVFIHGGILLISILLIQFIIMLFIIGYFFNNFDKEGKDNEKER